MRHFHHISWSPNSYLWKGSKHAAPDCAVLSYRHLLKYFQSHSFLSNERPSFVLNIVACLLGNATVIRSSIYWIIHLVELQLFTVQIQNTETRDFSSGSILFLTSCSTIFFLPVRRLSYSSFLIVRSLGISPLDCFLWTVSNLLQPSSKDSLCRLHREHLLEGLSLSVHENTSVVQETSVSVSVRITVFLCRYNENASVHCLGNDVSKLSPLIRLSGISRQWYRT
jgi:hypothetical protein